MDLGLEACGEGEGERGGDVGFVRVAEADADVGNAVVGVAEAVDVDAFGLANVGDGEGLDSKDDDSLVEDVVVPSLARSAKGVLLPPRLRNSRCRRRAGARGPGHAAGQDEGVQGPFVALALGGDQATSGLPGGEDREDDEPDEQRNPGAMGELGEVRSQEQQIYGQERFATAYYESKRLVPAGVDDVEEQDRGRGDGACHGHAKGKGERG